MSVLVLKASKKPLLFKNASQPIVHVDGKRGCAESKQWFETQKFTLEGEKIKEVIHQEKEFEPKNLPRFAEKLGQNGPAMSVTVHHGARLLYVRQAEHEKLSLTELNGYRMQNASELTDALFEKALLTRGQYGSKDVVVTLPLDDPKSSTMRVIIQTKDCHNAEYKKCVAEVMENFWHTQNRAKPNFPDKKIQP